MRISIPVLILTFPILTIACTNKSREAIQLPANASTWLTDIAINQVFDVEMAIPDVDTVLGFLDFSYYNYQGSHYNYTVYLYGKRYWQVHEIGLAKHAEEMAPTIYKALTDRKLDVDLLVFNFNTVGLMIDAKVGFRDTAMRKGIFKGLLTHL